MTIRRALSAIDVVDVLPTVTDYPQGWPVLLRPSTLYVRRDTSWVSALPTA